MKRGKPMQRGAPLERGDSRMKRTPLKRFGARKARESKAESAFRRGVLRAARSHRFRDFDGERYGPWQWLYWCARCAALVPAGDDRPIHIEAHHIVPRSRAPGWADLHNPTVNGAALCNRCHAGVHDHTAPDWPRWLKDLPCHTQTNTESPSASTSGLTPASGTASSSEAPPPGG